VKPARAGSYVILIEQPSGLVGGDQMHSVCNWACARKLVKMVPPDVRFLD